MTMASEIVIDSDKTAGDWTKRPEIDTEDGAKWEREQERESERVCVSVWVGEWVRKSIDEHQPVYVYEL